MTLLQELSLRQIEPSLPQTMSSARAGLDPYGTTDYTPDETSDEMGETNKLVRSFIDWLKVNQESIDKELTNNPKDFNPQSNNNSYQEEEEPQSMDNNIPPMSMGDDAESMEPNPMENESTDPNKQGMIRTVTGAHLIYKRKMEDGLYDELWGYNIDSNNRNDEYKIRGLILDGTDITPDSTSSEDGTQSYELWSIGNAQFVLITGLTN